MKIIEKMDVVAGVFYFLLIGGISILLLTRPKELKMSNTFRKITKRGILFRFLATGICCAVMYISFTLTMKISSVTETSIIVRIAPILTVVLSIIVLKEKIKIGHLLLSVFLCLVGIAVFKEIGFSTLKNLFKPFIFFGFLTALVGTVQFVLRSYIQKCDGFTNGFIVGSTQLIGSLFTFFFLLLSETKIVFPNLTQFFLLLLLGLFTTAVPGLLNLKAFELTNNLSKISFIDYLTPLFTGIIAFFINQERGFNYSKLIIGLALILAGVIIINKGVLKNQQKQN